MCSQALQISGGFLPRWLLNHQGFTGIADTETLCLCIYNDIDRHLNICCLIDIDMAVPGSRLNDRNGTLFHYRANQACASTWDKQVHVLVKTHKFLCRLSGSIFQYLNGICRQTDCVKRLTDYLQIARFEWIASLPPRRMTAFPVLKQSANASAVTFGRDS